MGQTGGQETVSSAGASPPPPLSGLSPLFAEMPAQWGMMWGQGMCRCCGNGTVPKTPGGGGQALPKWPQWDTRGQFST